LKNEEDIDFLTSPLTDFSALKYVQSEMLFTFQKTVTGVLGYCRWRDGAVL